MQQVSQIVGSVGRLTSSLEEARGQGVHRSFRARGQHPILGDVDVHLKMLSGKRLANELVAALLADAIGVKVPCCFAMEVDSSVDAEHVWNGRRYCFASCVVPGAVNLAASAVLANPPEVENFFRSEDWRAVVLLDTLAANSDRTPSNLLLDTSEHLWAIDHDTAFGGDWEVVDLQPCRHSTNLLARPCAQIPTEAQRHELLRHVKSRAPSLPVSELASLLPPIGLLPNTEAEALSLYIATRWRNLDELLRLALFSQY